jgi:hypothetical protein
LSSAAGGGLQSAPVYASGEFLIGKSNDKKFDIHELVFYTITRYTDEI